jgi:hypothetical protein
VAENVFPFTPHSHYSSERDFPLTPGARQPGKEFDEHTQKLTDLCQKQVNYWHKVDPLTDEQISGIKQIAKLAILHRSKSSLSFVNILHQRTLVKMVEELIIEKCFNPDLLYRTTQTMFRPLPASVHALQQYEDFDLNSNMLSLRFRLFRTGLLAGHIPSALWLWLAVPYDTPERKLEREFILRCLDDEKVNLVGKHIGILVKAVKADVAGDIKGALSYFHILDKLGLGEFEHLWKRRIQLLFAEHKQRALDAILSGIPWITAYMIANTLEELRNLTEDEQMKIRLSIHLHEFLPNKYTIKSIAESYESMGDTLMAREYYEIAGATGDKESQEWIGLYLMNKVMRRPSAENAKALESWRRMMNAGPDKKLSEKDI